MRGYVTEYADHDDTWHGRVHHVLKLPCQIWCRLGRVRGYRSPKSWQFGNNCSFRRYPGFPSLFPLHFLPPSYFPIFPIHSPSVSCPFPSSFPSFSLPFSSLPTPFPFLHLFPSLSLILPSLPYPSLSFSSSLVPSPFPFSLSSGVYACCRFCGE